MAKTRSKRQKLLRPSMLMLAAVCTWLAQHEPARFGAASLGSWLLGAVTVALLVMSALVLAGPALRIVTALSANALRERREGAEP
jgi:hypothetical protein